MAYRGFSQARMISMERMNAYVKEQFGLSHLHPSKSSLYRVQDTIDPWKPIYDLSNDFAAWKDDKTAQLALSTLEFLPVFEI